MVLLSVFFNDDLWTENHFLDKYAVLSQQILSLPPQPYAHSFVWVDLRVPKSVAGMAELVRCLLGLWLNDEPHKLGHNIMTQNPTHELLLGNRSIANTPVSLVAADNDRSTWGMVKRHHTELGDDDFLSTGALGPSCNRLQKTKKKKKKKKKKKNILHFLQNFSYHCFCL